jgi:hypothetical protein
MFYCDKFYIVINPRPFMKKGKEFRGALTILVVSALVLLLVFFGVRLTGNVILEGSNSHLVRYVEKDIENNVTNVRLYIDSPEKAIAIQEVFYPLDREVSRGNFEFKGGDHIFVPSSETLDSQRFTFSLWINPSKQFKDMSAGSIDILSKQLPLSSQGYFLKRGEPGSNKVVLGFYDEGGVLHEIKYDENRSNEWIHLAGTYDGSKLILYRNGKEKAVGEFQNLSVSSAESSLAIGSGFEGELDEAMMFNGALSFFEINKLYRYGRNIPYGFSNPDLSSWWKFDSHGKVEDVFTPGSLENNSVSTSGIQGEYTFSLWVKLDSCDGGNILGGSVTERLGGVLAWADKSETCSRIFMANRGAENRSLLVSSSKELVLGEWYHVALLNNGTHSRIYLNGESDLDWQEDLGLSSPLESLALGGMVVSVGGRLMNPERMQFFPGKIDEIMIFNKTLEKGQIFALTFFGRELIDDYFDHEALVSKKTFDKMGVIEDSVGSNNGEDYYGTIGFNEVNETERICEVLSSEVSPHTQISRFAGDKNTWILADNSSVNTEILYSIPLNCDVFDGRYFTLPEGALASYGFENAAYNCNGADINQDGVVDVVDLAGFALFYGNTNCSSTDECARADINQDGVVDDMDSSVFYDHFGKTNCIIETINGSEISGRTALCHLPGTAKEKTVWVGNRTAQTHLTHGDYLGVCDSRRIALCHLPGTAKEKTVWVGNRTAQTHLTHGDYLGVCENNPTVSIQSSSGSSGGGVISSGEESSSLSQVDPTMQITETESESDFNSLKENSGVFAKKTSNGEIGGMSVPLFVSLVIGIPILVLIILVLLVIRARKKRRLSQ